MFVYEIGALCAGSPECTRYFVNYIRRRLRPTKRLPFQIWMDEDSTPDKLIFRVEHVAGTSNRVVVDLSRKHRLKIDASNGSNWHHLKFEFVQFLRGILRTEIPDVV